MGFSALHEPGLLCVACSNLPKMLGFKGLSLMSLHGRTLPACGCYRRAIQGAR